MASDLEPDWRRRRVLAAWVPGLISLGLLARFALPGSPADFLGGSFYTALVYLLIAVALPRLQATTVGAVALSFSAAIEFFQLTGIPNDLARDFSPSRLVLGTSFAATDLIAYAAGAAAITLLDRRFGPPALQPRGVPAD